MKLPKSTVIKAAAVVLGLPVLLVIVVGGYFTVSVLARERPQIGPGTEHQDWTRTDCIECHEPIAAEWRQSFHYLSATGPIWTGLRAEGYDETFDTLRIPCMNCHAPANVLDLPVNGHPVERTNERDLGIDCVSCHVSSRGIVGPGRFTDAPHEVIADERFSDGALAATTICATCHQEDNECGTVISDWQTTGFAADGITCTDCHMPEVTAPIVTGGPPRLRQSHTFPGDKNLDMLRRALNASLSITEDGRAVVRLVNDRTGHSFPAAGMNSVIVNIKVRDSGGQVVTELEQGFGSKETMPTYLDFWPFMVVEKIPPGASREVIASLPKGSGTVEAEFRYRDWFSIEDQDLTIATMTEKY